MRSQAGGMEKVCRGLLGVSKKKKKKKKKNKKKTDILVVPANHAT